MPSRDQLIRDLIAVGELEPEEAALLATVLQQNQVRDPLSFYRHNRTVLDTALDDGTIEDTVSYLQERQRDVPPPRFDEPRGRQVVDVTGRQVSDPMMRPARSSSDAGPAGATVQRRSQQDQVIRQVVGGALGGAGLAGGQDPITNESYAAIGDTARFALDERLVPGGNANRYGSADAAEHWRRDGRDRTRNVTPREALTALYQLDEDTLIQLQQRLWTGGFYDQVGAERPHFGEINEFDVAAYAEFFRFAASRPHQSADQALAAAERIAILERGLAGTDTDGDGVADLGGAAPTFVAELQDPDALRLTIENISQELLGRTLDPATTVALIERINAKDTENQRALYETTHRDELSGSLPGDPPSEELEQFMAALGGQESGDDYNAVNERTGASGRFQILPSNWPAWARRAGLPANAPRTPENQERVARRILSDYYTQFGNWRDVAIAWYAGPGAAANPASRDRNRGHGEGGREPSINEYADAVVARMGRAESGIGAELADGGVAAGGYDEAVMTGFDPAAFAEAEMRRQNPEDYAATQYAQRARDFLGLITQPVV